MHYRLTARCCSLVSGLCSVACFFPPMLPLLVLLLLSLCLEFTPCFAFPRHLCPHLFSYANGLKISFANCIYGLAHELDPSIDAQKVGRHQM